MGKKSKNNWSKKYTKCNSCGTIRYPQQWRGYCQRCYPIIRKLEKAEKWDISNPDSLDGYHGFNIDGHTADEVYFNAYKCVYIKHLNDRLNKLKRWEQGMHGPIEGIDLELLLETIVIATEIQGWNQVYNKKSFFSECSKLFEKEFTPEQRLILYRMLNPVREAIPTEKIANEFETPYKFKKDVEICEHKLRNDGIG